MSESVIHLLVLPSLTRSFHSLSHLSDIYETNSPELGSGIQENLLMGFMEGRRTSLSRSSPKMWTVSGWGAPMAGEPRAGAPHWAGLGRLPVGKSRKQGWKGKVVLGEQRVPGRWNSTFRDPEAREHVGW